VRWKDKLQSIINVIMATVLQLIHPLRSQWGRLSPSARALPLHLWRAMLNFKNRGFRNAAALSYYAVFSVFPLSLLMAVGFSATLGPAVAQEQISQGLSLFIPQETETITIIQSNISEAVEQSASFGLVGLAALIWSALGLFSNLTSALDRIFQVPSSRGAWRERIQAFVMTLALIGLVAVSFITSGVLSLLDATVFATPSIWIRIGIIFLPLGFNLVIFVMLFRFVPARFVNWDAIWPAAILGAIMLETAKFLFQWYLANLATFQIVYGGLATAIVLLLWAYLTACIFLIAAEICSQLNLWIINQQEERDRVKIYIGSGAVQLPPEIPPPV